jgi:hypothetical protein
MYVLSIVLCLFVLFLLASHGGDRKLFEVMTSTLPKGTLGSVASLFAATLYQGDRIGDVMLTVLSSKPSPIAMEYLCHK